MAKHIFRKSQVWTIDLMTGITIFTLVIIMYYIFISNMTTSSNLNNINDEAIQVSSTLIDGFGGVNASMMGITDGHYRINATKFANVSLMNYDTAKMLLNAKYDFVVFFENRSNNVITLGGTQYIGKAGITKYNATNLKKDSMVSVSRLAIYSDDIVRMEVYMWE